MLTTSHESAELQRLDTPLTLLDVLVILAARLRFIFATCAICSCLALGLALSFRPEYTSTAVIMPPERPRSSLSAFIGQLGMSAELGSASVPGLTNPADIYVGILKGETIADELISKFGLRAQYERKTLYETRRALSNHTHFATGKDTLIKISVDDPEPAKAAAIANAYIEALHAQTSRLALTEAAQRRVFFEREIQGQRNRLAEAETQMKGAQEKTGLFHLSGQLETSVRAAAELQAGLTGKEVLLQRLKSGATAQNPDVVNMETELAALRSELRRLQSGRNLGSPIVGAQSIPQSGLTYLRGIRELQYQETLYQAMAKQYEAAKIDEAKDAPLIQVVDRAMPPDRKSWPPRVLITLFGSLGGLIVACTIVLSENHVRASGNLQKVSRLRTTLSRNFRRS